MAERTQRYFNRELSWLEFNERVLDEARDVEIPLLERLRFLAITASNLDELFMVRVGGLQILSRQNSRNRDPSGMTPDEQLGAVSKRTHTMTADQYGCYLNVLQPQLAEAGIRRVMPADLSDHQTKVVEEVFEDEIGVVLTPIAVTAAENFPLLMGRTLNVCVQLKPAAAGSDEPRFAIIPLGRSAPRFITLPSDGGYDYLLLEDMLGMYIERFFPGEQIVDCVPFRITRNADLSVREDLASDLLSQMREVIDARKQSDCVRLEISEGVTTQMLTFLSDCLDVQSADVYATSGPIDLAVFMQLADLRGFNHLKYKPWPPQQPPQIDPKVPLFDVLARQDVLLVHPYESFQPVVRLIEEAADDPDVLAIKQTLYRTSRNSPIVQALIRAAERGKYVTVIVELKARFDEARNIDQARALEQAGAQVIYGVKGLKTHSKICLIVRREPHGIQRYLHFGTGNYNESTARLYSDVSFMTCDEELGADATSFFNAVTGYSQPQKFRRIEAAPIGLREKLLDMIRTETELKRSGQPARITAKLNSLVDPSIIDALYEASRAGVEIQLNIRGICCLRPGVPGLSEHITVVSIVGRFLEHARIFWFHHHGDERVFISSADWMPRNLDRRVELLVPVDDDTGRRRLMDILELYFRDTLKARRLLPGGRYERITPPEGAGSLSSQEQLYQQAVQAVKQARQRRQTLFEPHRAPEPKL